MSKFSSAVRSMRLRTLPLSLSGVCLGMLLAASDYHVSLTVAIFTILTTVSLQVLSNLSNELGDYYHGTDTADRLGPNYGLMEGGLKVSDMKLLIGGAILCCIVFGLLMIRASFGTLLSLESVCLMMLGAAAISGAMKYTLGRNPYGYQGLGDIFVFIFFGLVSVLGSYFVAAHTIPSWIFLLPATSIGLFSVGVLNVNNIRDMKTDAENRVTVAIRLGEKRARIYQTVLIVMGWVCMIAFCLLRFFDPWHYLFILTLPMYIKHVSGVWKLNGKDLDRMLPLLVISTFLFALLAGFGFVKFLIF
ncbi:MAG: 1,4-dihydroxy-2-naphthoate octaprenyltransferase [Bacteroidales bacterium]|nr:1,4-dihydroxy-2-naphthoate octaprenyltransferase [Bacteroidales bacterium]MBR1435522.1 1,4-dihydroxy-2-naphthoate octaprenyltransferase [Bacteroidales bacterium]